MIKQVTVMVVIAMSLLAMVPVASANCWVCQYSGSSPTCYPTTEYGYSWCVEWWGSCILGDQCGGWEVERARRVQDLASLTEKDALRLILMIYREEMKSLVHKSSSQVGGEKATDNRAKLPPSHVSTTAEAR
jgi:hypothetical protein